MEFRSHICPQGIVLLTETTKTEVLLRLANTAAEAGKIINSEQLIKDIFYREQLMSTGIGLGIAIPHVRFKEFKKPVIIVGVQPEGIEDYPSIDDQPVKIVIMILVGENQHKEHIRLLSQIVAFLKTENVIDRLCAADSSEKIFAIMTEPPHE